jgi:hypothetical protein
MKTTYRDQNGNLVFVSPGISDGTVWMTVRQKPGKTGTRRLTTKALPLRDTEMEAQADLDAYAKTKGFPEVPSTDSRARHNQ